MVEVAHRAVVLVGAEDTGPEDWLVDSGLDFAGDVLADSGFNRRVGAIHLRSVGECDDEPAIGRLLANDVDGEDRLQFTRCDTEEPRQRFVGADEASETDVVSIVRIDALPAVAEKPVFPDLV